MLINHTSFRPALVAVLLLGFGLGCSAPQKSPLVATAEKVDARGIMEKDSYLQVRAVTDRIAESGSVSDSDLGLMLSQMNASGPKTTPSYARLRVAAGLALLKRYEPGQKERIWSAFSPLFKSADANDQRAAIAIAEAQKNPDGPALVVPLLDSPHDHVRQAAQKYLDSSGFSRAD